MLFKILTSYNAVYHEIGLFKSTFVFVLGAITQHHETSISSKLHVYSPLKREASLGRPTDRGEGAHKNQTRTVVMTRSVMADEASQMITTD